MPLITSFDNRGVGALQGRTPGSIAEMAKDAGAFVRPLGFDQVDLLGFSMGGLVAQVIAEEQPDLARTIILAATGPAGGEGIDKVTLLTYLDVARGALAFRDAKYHLFFTQTNGRSEARAFLKWLKERPGNRDKAISVPSFRAHLKAIHGWAVQQPRDLSRIQQAVFVANGDRDWMVPSHYSADLAGRLPNAHLKIYPTPATAASSRTTQNSSRKRWTSSMPDTHRPGGPRP